MSINYVLIGAMAILLIAIIVGGIRGFIKTFFAAFSVAIALFVAVQAGPYLGKVLQHTPMYTMISGQVEEKLDAYSEAQAEKVSQQIEEINRYPLPQYLKNALIENNNNQIYEALGVSRFNQYVASYMACLVLNSVSFLIVFLLAFIILKVIEAGLDLISKLPVLHSINLLGGLVCGVVHGMIILWILCIVITMFAWTEAGQWALSQVNESALLSLLYNHNYILSALTNMGKMLF